MIKKLLSFCFLLFITFISFSQETYYDGIQFLNLSGTPLKTALATRITTTHTNLLSYSPGVWEASKTTDINPGNTTQVILIYGWEAGNDTDITNDKFNNTNLIFT